MDQSDLILSSLGLCPLIIAAGYLAAGGWIIIRNQPLLFRASLFEWLTVVALLPLLGIVLYAVFTNPALICLSFIWLGLVGSLAYAIRRDSVEYMVIAVREEALHAALRASLAQLGIPYDESVAGFTLPALNDTLQVRFQVRMGTAQLRLKSRHNFPRLKEIALATRAHLKADRESAMVRDGWIYAGLGLFVLVFALSIFQQG